MSLPHWCHFLSSSNLSADIHNGMVAWIVVFSKKIWSIACVHSKSRLVAWPGIHVEKVLWNNGTCSSCCGRDCSCPGPLGSQDKWHRRRRSEFLHPPIPLKKKKKQPQLNVTSILCAQSGTSGSFVQPRDHREHILEHSMAQLRGHRTSVWHIGLSMRTLQSSPSLWRFGKGRLDVSRWDSTPICPRSNPNPIIGLT